MYSLSISGEPVRRQNYTRIPMIDSLGEQVTAYVRWNCTNYRPLGGTEDSRHFRARLIANALGGEVREYDRPAEGDGGSSRWIAQVPFD